MTKIKLGFYAVKNGTAALCNGISLIVTHDKNTIRELAPLSKRYVYMDIYLHHTLAALNLGAEYDFDTPAFNILKEHFDVTLFDITELNDQKPTLYNVKLKQ